MLQATRRNQNSLAGSYCRFLGIDVHLPFSFQY